MFKIIKLELFDKFQCLMGKCQDNCCNENWTITVDDSAYELYQKMGIRDLNSKISSNIPHIILKKDGKCPFITTDGLCVIHKELGEDYLCNTCKSYPRFVSFYENAENDLFIENIGLSCPAAAEWVVGLNHVCVLEEQVLYEQQEEVGKEAKPLDAELRMKEIILPLQSNDKFEEGMSECYRKAGGEYTSLELKFFKEKDLLLRNISICFLFENLMLESKKEKADNIKVLDRVCRIIKGLDLAIGEKLQAGIVANDVIVADCLYKIMRKEDHVNVNEGINI